MPLVRISLRQGTTAEYRRAIADGVHSAMLEVLAVPADDRFQVITEHNADGLIYDLQYLGIQRSDRVVFVQITLSAGRKPQQKRQLYKRMAEILAENPGLRPQDLLINLVEVAWENWSFGSGEAQYMDRQLAPFGAAFAGPTHPVDLTNAPFSKFVRRSPAGFRSGDSLCGFSVKYGSGSRNFVSWLRRQRLSR
jgi:4-oxalocrotonate tautomerase